MSEFVDNAVNAYNNIVRGLNEAAFGDIRNVFRNSEVDYLLGKPIGLVANSYDFIASHLRRNIGNTIHHYDGFSTPIGELANPFFNSFFAVPWFFMDSYKNSTANYLDYVRATYGATISVENINNNYDIQIIGRGSNVGVIQTSALKDVIYGKDTYGSISLINPNGLFSDTKLGLDGTYYAGRTLYNATVGNDNRKIEGKINGITEDLRNYFGLNTAAVENDVLNISSHNKGESYLSTGYYNLNIVSPLEKSNYGNYTDLGVYEGYYNSLGEDSKFHVNENLFGRGKKYYPKVVSRSVDENGEQKSTLVSKGKTYLGSVGISVGHDTLSYESEKIDENGVTVTNIDELQIRYVFGTIREHSNITNVDGGVYVYSENEYGSSTDIYSNPFNSGTRFGTYTSYNSDLTADDLLKKTNLAFKRGNYNTIIARFHTNSDKSNENETDTTQTAVSSYGLSHGRNLLKLSPDKSQGYDNPYCRTWTYHHQYHRLADSIRPFQEKGEKGSVVITQEDLYNKYGFNEFSADNTDKGFENGRVRLGKYGVTNQHNGLVNITPIDNGDPNKSVSIKNCMFSIENLAWKDSWSSADKEKETFQNGGLSSEQKGPFGGRIMWFPPYGLKFNETISVDWNSNAFIGRGENIYTYKNTTRSGQLSFKLLIDHPSIINYWENRGRSVSNSVDALDDPEQQLLRFFAGCEMLSSKKAQTKKVDVAVKQDPEPYPNTDVYTFYVFFPNNYSGVDDKWNEDYAVNYLTNGVGTWKLKDGSDYSPSYSIATVDGKTVGGYEMTPGINVSIVKKRGEEEFITSVQYGGQTSVDIYAQIGAAGENDYDNKWYYRIDKTYINDNLKKPENYFAIDSQCLNSSAGATTVFNIAHIDDYDKLFSFADVFVALTESNNGSNKVLDGLYDHEKVNLAKELLLGEKKNYIKEIICTGQASKAGDENKNKVLAKNRAETISNWLKKYTKLTNISTKTIPSEGNVENINSLPEKTHRCVRVDIYVTSESSKTAQEAEQDKYRSSDENESKFVHPTRPNYPNNTGTGTHTIIDDMANIYYDQNTLQNKATYMKLSTFAKSVDYLTFNLKNSYDNNTLNVNGVFNALENFRDINMASKDLALDFPGNDRIGLDFSDTKGGKETDETRHDMNNSSVLKKQDESYESREQEMTKIKRYDNESKFFEMLEVEEPFLHQKISDKVKYFDPAFHSISPEGFNARLTFLQQCSRQGPTCGANDVNIGSNTANNLAFGRPPVCILRVGDFYYTKIIIESITIDFGDVMWDLNAEGIGVMPMIADINISFKYIGGSSLSGPISRLQNALSFNAYANTEVYDNRAELAEFDNNGNITKFAPYNPSK